MSRAGCDRRAGLNEPGASPGNLPLTVRDAPGSSPLRVVPASTANLPLSSNIFSDGYPTLVAVSAAAPPARVAAMANAGASIVTCGVSRVDLKTLLEHLHDGGIKSLIVEGGATLLAALFRRLPGDREPEASGIRRVQCRRTVTQPLVSFCLIGSTKHSRDLPGLHDRWRARLEHYYKLETDVGDGDFNENAGCLRDLLIADAVKCYALGQYDTTPGAVVRIRSAAPYGFWLTIIVA
jgi:hypothetical protein